MTAKQRKILAVLADGKAHTPTEIGLECGARYDCASGYACDAINRMAVKGWVIYKRLIGAQITEEGRKALET